MMFRRTTRSEPAADASAAPLAQPEPPGRWAAPWVPLVGAIGLPFAFAPFGQFYLAWVGLVPWLMFVYQSRRTRSAFLWSWLAGTVYFAINIWWLSFVTLPGTIGSVIYMGLYWAIAAMLLRWLAPIERWRTSAASILGMTFIVATVWTALEWVRGTLLTGWPWSHLGYAQTPILPLVQIADVTGVYGVSFLLALGNATVVAAILNRHRSRAIVPAACVFAVLVAGAIGYGLVRLNDERALAGPRVLVVQSNFPQSNTGEKGATEEELLAFHVTRTDAALDDEASGGRTVDLVVWSETMMPEINPEARAALRRTMKGPALDEALEQLSGLARRHGVALLVGGTYADDFERTPDGYIIPRDRRNVAYYVRSDGELTDLRYDKIHLVPFGEFIPFKQSIPWLFRLFISLGPYDFDYTLTPGAWEALTAFELPAPAGSEAPVRFVTPICFEDADAALVARMFRGQDGRKRADLIVNITNDGWFSQPQLSQHLQMARFRSIENRVPTARSVNTGISAFIDSGGRVVARLPVQEEGVLVRDVKLDPRVTLFTRWGEWFPQMCGLILAGVGGARLGVAVKRHRGRGHG